MDAEIEAHLLNLRLQNPVIDLRAPLSVDDAMKVALREAYRGAGHVAPNPQVGCAVLDEKGLLVSSGYHAKYGEGHAEVNALKGVSPKKLQGAHVIVTLEPCAHHGKTPSCAKMLAQLPIRKVTYGIQDPNPLVAGKGAQILKDAGKDVELFDSRKTDLVDELKKACEVFLVNMIEQRPFVALKLAQSLDGKMNLRNGNSQWITSEESREQSHFLRAVYETTIVGVQTVIADRPLLTIRHPHFQKQNRVVILDPNARLLKSTDLISIPLLKHYSAQSLTWVVSSEFEKNNFSHLPFQILFAPVKNEQLDLNELLKALWTNGHRSLFVEGGPITLSRFLQAKLWDRLHLFQAPCIIGEQGQPSWAGSSSWSQVSEAPRMKTDEWGVFGSDLYCSGRRL